MQQLEPKVNTKAKQWGMLLGACCACGLASSVAPAWGQRAPQRWVGEMAPVSIAAGLVLGQLEAGTISPEDAWNSHTLTLEDISAQLEQKGILKDQAKEKLRNGLLEMLIAHGQELWLPDKKTGRLPNTPGMKPLSIGLRQGIADYLSSKRDERAVPAYEAMLGDIERANKAGKPLDESGAVLHLADFYTQRGEFQKALEILQSGDKYVSTPYHLAAVRLDMARIYHRMGNEKKAAEIYAQVAQYGNGYLSGLALFDQARSLIAQGKHEEARKLLLQPLNGPDTESAQVAQWALLADSYYRTGDLEQARKFGQQVVKQYAALSQSRQNMVLSTFKLAQNTLRLVEQWTKEPIIVEPHELQVGIGAGHHEPIIRRLTVRTFRDVPLTASTSSPLIKAHVVTTDEWGDAKSEQSGFDVTKEVVVEIAPEAAQGATDATVTIGSTEITGFQAQVLLKVWGNKAESP